MKRAAHPVGQEEVMAYLDGELGSARAAGIAAHLDECAGCSALAAELRRVSLELMAWRVEPSPPRLSQAVIRAIEQRCESRATGLPFPARPQRRRWLPGMVWKTAAVLGVPLLILIVIYNPMRWSRALLLESQVSRRPIVVGVPRDEMALPHSSLESSRLTAGTAPAEAEKPAGPMIVRNATVVLVGKEFDGARAALERIVREHGGYLAQLNVAGQANMARTLSATLRVPAAQLEGVLAELKKLGRAEQESQSGEEVTQQYVDLVARLSNARATEKRLIEVLQQRTGKVGDVLEVEREIARVRGEIERLDAQLKNMDKQVRFATVQFQLREDFKANLEATPRSTGTRLWNALAEGYNSAAESALGTVLFLLSAGPTLLLWAAILFWPARLVWRRIRARFRPNLFASRAV